MYLILKKNPLEYDFDKRNILEWGFEAEERTFDSSRRVGHSEDIGSEIGVRLPRLYQPGEKERIVYWVILFARAQAMPIILSKKNTGISLFFSICFGRENLPSFSMTTFTRHKDDYLYPIWDFIVSITAEKKWEEKEKKKRENVKFRAPSELFLLLWREKYLI